MSYIYINVCVCVCARAGKRRIIILPSRSRRGTRNTHTRELDRALRRSIPTLIARRPVIVVIIIYVCVCVNLLHGGGRFNVVSRFFCPFAFRGPTRLLLHRDGVSAPPLRAAHRYYYYYYFPSPYNKIIIYPLLFFHTHTRPPSLRWTATHTRPMQGLTEFFG